ncbi:SprB repeat-containing protein, partial [Aquimarina sp. 2201CG14-23]|uniref:SprB repeat-containing protein n=1 Tax=Aquimarina mycalae TaxID=3040073 RepID=UPI0024781758
MKRIFFIITFLLLNTISSAQVRYKAEYDVTVTVTNGQSTFATVDWRLGFKIPSSNTVYPIFAATVTNGAPETYISDRVIEIPQRADRMNYSLFQDFYPQGSSCNDSFVTDLNFDTFECFPFQQPFFACFNLNSPYFLLYELESIRSLNNFSATNNSIPDCDSKTIRMSSITCSLRNPLYALEYQVGSSTTWNTLLPYGPNPVSIDIQRSDFNGLDLRENLRIRYKHTNRPSNNVYSEILTYNFIPCSPKILGVTTDETDCADGLTGGSFTLELDRTIDSGDVLNFNLFATNPFRPQEDRNVISSEIQQIGSQYFFTWDNLPAGQYRVQYQLNMNGSVEPPIGSPLTFTISSPIAVTFNTSKTDISCISGQGASNNGSITISGITGGTGSYQYSINGSSFIPFSGNNITLSNQSDGPYTIRVQDSNNCNGTSGGNISVTETINPATAITIANTPSPVVNVTVFGGNNGSISPTVSGGTTPPLSYSWSGPSGFSSTQLNITNLIAGTYTLTVTDNPEGCSISRNFTVTEPDQLVFNPATVTPVDCNGNSNGTIAITASGGLPDYRFELFKDNGAGTFLTTGDILNTSSLTTTTFNVIGLSAGVYRVRLTDNRNNANPEVVINSTDITINEPPVFQIQNINPIDALCKGGATGSIVLDIIGGAGLYQITMTKSGDPGFSRVINNIPNNSLSYPINNLAEGTYTLTLTDANSCTVINPTAERIITVAEPTTSVSINPLSVVSPTAGNSDGSISVQGQGGTPPYTYSWNTGQTLAAISNLSDGSYTVTVTDDNGCDIDQTFTLNELEVTISITPGEEVLCSNDTAGFTANPTGGDNNYTYNWYNQNNL